MTALRLTKIRFGLGTKKAISYSQENFIKINHMFMKEYPQNDLQKPAQYCSKYQTQTSCVNTFMSSSFE